MTERQTTGTRHNANLHRTKMAGDNVEDSP